MNIAILSPEYPPYTNWGGVATFNYNLGEAFSRIGDTVHVITYDGVGDTERIEKRGAITIHYVRYKTDNRLINLLYYRLIFGWIRKIFLHVFPKFIQTIDWNFFSFFYFRKLHKTLPIEVLHCPTYHAPSLFISLIFRTIPSILYVQGPQEYLNAYELYSWDNIIKSKLENWYTRHCAKKIVACSKNVRKKLLSQFPDLGNKIAVIPNFIDISALKAAPRVNLNRIVFMGRLEYRKGVDVLLQAFIELAKKNSRIMLYLIGDKKETTLCKDKAVSFEMAWRSLALPQHIVNRIVFYPRIDDKKALIQLLESIRGVAVFPSRYEPFGFVTIEAMALGYVVIAGDNSGGREIVVDGVNGFLASPTKQSLVSVLHRVHTLSQEEANRISRTARQCVKERYSVNVVMDQLKDLEKSVI